MQSESPSQSEAAQEGQFFTQKPVLRLFIIGFLFITAFGIRLYRINEPPLDFVISRQYRSALIARAYYLNSVESIPQWRKQVANINKQIEGIMEPPLMELVASSAYRILGGEHLWIPRLLSSIFWLIGSAFLYLLAKEVVNMDAAVFSTAFYLLLPFGISASRSFQPDPLMVTMMLFSIFTIFRYHNQPSIRGFAIAASISALAFFIKPFSLFPILGTFVLLSICRLGIWKSVSSWDLLIFVVLTPLATIFFYAYSIFVEGHLQGQIRGSFIPELLFNPFFYTGWLNQIKSVVGYTAFIGAGLGVLMFRGGLPKALLVGQWVGYFLFGLTFTWQIHTHHYYHLQLIPIVALSLGPIVALIMNRLNQVCKRWPLRVVVLCILGVAVLLSIRETRERLNRGDQEYVKMAEEIGEEVKHSTKTVLLDSCLGYPLRYHGEFAGVFWPISADFRTYENEELRGQRELSAEEQFNTLYSEYSPEYFIITDFREFEKQVDLKDFLVRKYRMAAKKDNYLIFDLRKRDGVGR